MIAAGMILGGGHFDSLTLCRGCSLIVLLFEEHHSRWSYVCIAIAIWMRPGFPGEDLPMTERGRSPRERGAQAVGARVQQIERGDGQGSASFQRGANLSVDEWRNEARAAASDSGGGKGADGGGGGAVLDGSGDGTGEVRGGMMVDVERGTRRGRDEGSGSRDGGTMMSVDGQGAGEGGTVGLGNVRGRGGGRARGGGRGRGGQRASSEGGGAEGSRGGRARRGGCSWKKVEVQRGSG